MNQKNEIFIYSGPGASKRNIEQVQATLHKTLCLKYQLKTISAKKLIEDPWEETAALFVLPGGADLPYVKQLNGAGNRKIRDYVEKGGSFLGICAGSYYAGSFVEFAKGTPNEITGVRELSFFKGKVIGPLLKEYTCEDDSGSLAASILWNQTDFFKEKEAFTLFYSGGGYFLDAHHMADTAVLAHYSIGEDYPAIIECKVGRGVVILSAAHFEYDPFLLNPQDAYLQELLPELQKGDEKRKALASHLCKRLKLQERNKKTQVT